jgi:hypothetical protein
MRNALRRCILSLLPVISFTAANAADQMTLDRQKSTTACEERQKRKGADDSLR